MSPFVPLLVLALGCHRAPPSLVDELRAAPADSHELLQCLLPSIAAGETLYRGAEDAILRAGLEAARARGHGYADLDAYLDDLRRAIIDIGTLPPVGTQARANVALCRMSWGAPIVRDAEVGYLVEHRAEPGNELRLLLGAPSARVTLPDALAMRSALVRMHRLCAAAPPSAPPAASAEDEPFAQARAAIAIEGDLAGFFETGRPSFSPPKVWQAAEADTTLLLLDELSHCYMAHAARAAQPAGIDPSAYVWERETGALRYAQVVDLSGRLAEHRMVSVESGAESLRIHLEGEPTPLAGHVTRHTRRSCGSGPYGVRYSLRLWVPSTP